MALGNKNRIKADGFRPIKNNVFISQLDSGPHVTAGGIIRIDDNMSATGIRPRWGQVWAIGPEVKDIEVGEWVYIHHARWTNSIDIELPSGVTRVWKVDWPEAVLMACTDDPRETHLAALPKMHRLVIAGTPAKIALSPAIIRKRDM